MSRRRTGRECGPGGLSYSAKVSENASWELSVDSGTAVTGSAVAGATLTVPIDTASWADGSTHTFVLTARDSLGNPSTRSTSVTADTVGPVLGIGAPTAGLLASWTGASGSVSDAAGVQKVELEFREAGCVARVAGPFTAALDGHGAWTTGAWTLADGDYCVNVTATDNVGNSTSRQFLITVDATSPASFGAIAPQGWVLHSGEFSWTPSSDVHGVNYTLYVDSGVATIGYPASGTSLTKNLAPGDYDWWVTARDSLGNVTSTTRSDVHVVGVPQLQDPDAGLLFSNELAVEWTDVHAPGGVDSFEVEFAHGDDTFTTEVDADDLTLVQSFGSELPGGEWTIRVRAVYVDEVEEFGTRIGPWSETVAVIRDATAPEIGFSAPLDGAQLALGPARTER